MRSWLNKASLAYQGRRAPLDEGWTRIPHLLFPNEAGTAWGIAFYEALIRDRIGIGTFT
jgi:hypothetical protein